LLAAPDAIVPFRGAAARDTVTAELYPPPVPCGQTTWSSASVR